MKKLPRMGPQIRQVDLVCSLVCVSATLLVSAQLSNDGQHSLYITHA